MHRLLPRLVALVLPLALAAGAFAQDPADTIAAVLRDTPELSALSELLDGTGMMAALERPGRLTLFAPSDAAFEEIGDEGIADLLRDRGSLDLIMRHHLVQGVSPLAALRELDAVTTLEGTRLNVTDTGERVRVNAVLVPNEPIRAGNGLVYVVDHLLIPGASVMRKDLLANPQAD